MQLELPDLPYPSDALEPVISARTLAFHHGEHHKGYVDKAAKAVADTPLAGAPVELVLRQAHADGDQGLFNNAAQVWNHSFYWRCLQPAAGQEPDGAFKVALEAAFGSVAAMMKPVGVDIGGKLFLDLAGQRVAADVDPRVVG